MFSMRSMLMAVALLPALVASAQAQTNAPNRDHPKQAEFAQAAAAPGGHTTASGGDTIYFTYQKIFLTKEAVEVVKRQAAWLKAHPALKVRLECHTDDGYALEESLEFGDTRCRAVETILIKNGINAGRITARSFGSQKPAVAVVAEPDRAKNRRVVSKITD